MDTRDKEFLRTFRGELEEEITRLDLESLRVAEKEGFIYGMIPGAIANRLRHYLELVDRRYPFLRE